MRDFSINSEVLISDESMLSSPTQVQINASLLQFVVSI